MSWPFSNADYSRDDGDDKNPPQIRPSLRDTPSGASTRRRNSPEKTQWASNDDFIDEFLDQGHAVKDMLTDEQKRHRDIRDQLGQEDDAVYVHDQLPSAAEVRMMAASSGRMSSSKRCCGKPVVMIAMLAVTICAIILGLSIGLSGQDKNVEATGEGLTATSDDATRLIRTVALLSQVSDPKELEDLSTPRRRAAEWLAQEDPANMSVPETVGEGKQFIERYVAALIYFSMNGPSWEAQLDFLSEKHVCDWQATYPAGDGGPPRKVGIGCRSDKTVQDINLPGNQLKGTIPIEIGEYRLLLLNLNTNEISGTIPSALLNSDIMVLLALQHNDLMGTVPEWLGGMTNLKVLYLGNNDFAGSLPPEFAQMTSLQSLALSKNDLRGDLSVLQGLPSLSHIYADNNLFEGTLEETFAYMPQLKELDMSSNKLKGTLPPYFFEMKELEILVLSDNEMKGVIPDIPEESALTYLGLSANSFDGTIPASIQNAQGLTHVDLSGNYFRGTMPEALSSLSNLKYLFLGENRFSPGPIPAWIENLQELQDLCLMQTGLTGSIPSFLMSMTNLVLLDLQKNALTDKIPTKRIGSGASQLKFILLNRNNLTGSIPLDVSRISNLDMLSIDHNSFTGNLDEVCNRPSVPRVVTADCKGAAPEIKCDCCSLCCAEGDDSCNDEPYVGEQDPIWENSFVRKFYEFAPSITYDGTERN